MQCVQRRSCGSDEGRSLPLAPVLPIKDLEARFASNLKSLEESLNKRLENTFAILSSQFRESFELQRNNFEEFSMKVEVLQKRIEQQDERDVCKERPFQHTTEVADSVSTQLWTLHEKNGVSEECKRVEESSSVVKGLDDLWKALKASEEGLDVRIKALVENEMQGVPDEVARDEVDEKRVAIQEQVLAIETRLDTLEWYTQQATVQLGGNTEKIVADACEQLNACADTDKKFVGAQVNGMPLVEQEVAQEDLASKRTSDRESTEEDVASLGEEYTFEPTVWDASLFIGTPAMGIGASVITAFLLLVMGCVLSVFSGIVIEDFTDGDSFNSDVQQQLWRYRLLSAHLYSNADYELGVSLASRVCNSDASLLVATSQSNMVGDLLSYLPNSDSTSETFTDYLFSGPALHILAVFTWCLTILSECLSILRLVRALMFLHGRSREGATSITCNGECFSIRAFPCSRILFGFFVAALRTIMCAILAYAGTCFILSTVGMQDILLNCTALCFIFDVKSMMYDSLAPRQTQTLVENMKPISLPSWRSFHGIDLPTSFGQLAIFVSVSIIGVTAVAPFKDQVQKSYDIVCGGIVDFVAKQNALGVVWAVDSAKFGSDLGELTELFSTVLKNTVQSTSVNAAIDAGFVQFGGHGTHVGHHAAAALDNFRKFEETVTQSWFNQLHYEGHANEFRLAENRTTYYTDGYRSWKDPIIFRLRMLLDNQTSTCQHLYQMMQLEPPNVVGASCYHTDHERYLDGISQIRALCPWGCGCYSPIFGTLYKNSHGCPEDTYTNSHFKAELAQFPCEDTSNYTNQTLLSWIRTWSRSIEFQRIFQEEAQKSPKHPQVLPDPTSPAFCEVVHSTLQHKMRYGIETNGPVVCPLRYGCTGVHLHYTIKPYCPPACASHP